MRHFPFALLVFALTPLSVGAADSAEALSWFAGCWQQQRGEHVYEEHWMRPAGGILLGISRTLRQGELRGTEFLRIDAEGEGGRLRYVAMPSGQSLTIFLATQVADGVVVFENPGHDFPQRIAYRRERDALVARIEGTDGNGSARAFDFEMQRVSCVDE